MKLLLIDDNKYFADTLAEDLKKNYVVNISSTGEDGEFQAQTNQYDLIILDLMLPDKDGFTVCKNIRRSGLETPILILTGEMGLKTKVDLLDSGADDYLTKPFKFAELAARIRALLRRKGNKLQSNTIIINDLVLDLDKKIVRREKQTIHLRRKEYYLLEYLARNVGNVLSRGMILEHVWEDEPDMMTNVVDVHIKYLRDKIDRPFENKLIKTIHGIGYKIEA